MVLLNTVGLLLNTLSVKLQIALKRLVVVLDSTPVLLRLRLTSPVRVGLKWYGTPSKHGMGLMAWFCTTLLSIVFLIFGVNENSHAQSSKPPQQINNLRLWHSPDRTRVVFDVSANVRHTMFVLQNPLRLVVDIDNANLKIQLPDIDASNLHIKAVRSGRPEREKLRFVFELHKPLVHSSFLLSPNELYGHRLVVDLEDKAKQFEGALPINAASGDSSATGVSPQTNRSGEIVSDKEPSPTIQAPAALAKPAKLVVAVDAGHGGEDPGAIGYRGSYEKRITLSIARRLADKINSDSRMDAVLIRDGDYYVDLEKRRTTARKLSADIFVSIHADAFRKKTARGLSVFALSQRGATSAMARALAAKENASDLIGGVSLARKDQVLAQVLVDLSMTNTISESVNLGGRVLNELSKVGKLHSRRVEQAGFAVLKSPDMPSILVETGFITNPDEERNLNSPSYQNKIAQAIYTAIDQYYEQTPYSSKATYTSRVRPNTNVARVNASSPTQTTPIYHTVVRGDSLSKIAERYRVSLRELKRVNRLRSNTAVLGKRLKLPSGAQDRIRTKTASPNSPNATPAAHIVKRGDSLSRISARYNLTISFLKRLNKLTKNTLYVGQKIKLSANQSTAANSSKPTQKPSKPIVHKVRRGDTLSEIAEKYGTSIGKIKAENKLRSGVIRLGQKLKIPN